VVLAAICMPLQWLVIAAPNGLLIAVVEVAMAVFYGHTVVVLLAFVLLPGAVGADRMDAAVSVYILLGSSGRWDILRWSIGPGVAFATTVPDLSGHRFAYDDLLYSSFATPTSTGYGDIVPVSQGTRSLAVFEHIVGVMYIASLIARLAGCLRRNKRPGRARA
jgi:hypothetical protein